MAERCSANPRSAGESPPPCAFTIHLNNSNSKASMKTYSKRYIENYSEPCRKRQRIECATKVVLDTTTNTGFPSNTPTLPKKRSISEYFKPVTHKKSSSSPRPSVFSSDPVQKKVESPPSSPPLPQLSPSAPLPRARKRRRLTTRVPLGLIMMSDLNAGGIRDDGDEGHRDNGKRRPAKKGAFYPGSPSRKSYLGKSSSPGSRQAARGGTSSEEDDNGEEEDSADHVTHRKDGILRSDPIDIVGERGHQPEGVYIPFAPHRPYTFRGLGHQRSSVDSNNQLNAFSNADTSVEQSTIPTGAIAHIRLPSTAQPPSRWKTTPIDEDLVDISRMEMLHATQSGEQDLAFGMGDERTDPSDRAVPGAELINTVRTSRAEPHVNENPTRVASDLITAAVSTQSHAAGQLIVEDTATSVVGVDTQSNITAAGIIVQHNIPHSGNALHGPGNLVQAQLALGNATNITCNMCRFTFNRTLAADVATHQQYHDARILGEPVIGLTTNPRYHLQSIDTGIGQGDYVVLVDSSSTQGWKNLAMAVLQRHVDMELDALPTDETRLWSSIEEPATQRGTIRANRIDRYQVYMYIRRYQPKIGRVASLLLAERIKSGCETSLSQVEHDEFGPWPSIVPKFQTNVSDLPHEAVLGVNKFWTVRSSRYKGFAKILLGQARQHMIRLYTIPCIHIAWTHTTEDGAKFAKKYLQNQAPYDFLTYDDQE